LFTQIRIGFNGLLGVLPWAMLTIAVATITTFQMVGLGKNDISLW
jgi:hypothetical protein